MQNQDKIESWKKLLDQTTFSKNILILSRLFQKETLYKNQETIRIIRHGRVYRVQEARLNQSRKRYHPKKFFKTCVKYTTQNTKHNKVRFRNFFVWICIQCIYHKVVSTSMSRLAAHFQIFRMLMKGKFDAYVLSVFLQKNTS